jgi:soluble lytic murein transglycosylase-like protein
MKKKQKQKIKFALFVILSAFAINHLTFPVMAVAPSERQNFLPINPDKKELAIQDKIILAARRSGVDESAALAIAWCESRFDPAAKNKNSTATGVYQFLMGTWWNYCRGDVRNADDNIACFMKLYPAHPGWWECHRTLYE